MVIGLSLNELMEYTAGNATSGLTGSGSTVTTS
jgi:hypothetical protein